MKGTKEHEMSDGTFELAEISAAKDLVMIELEDVVEAANGAGDVYDAITIADRIVEKLLKSGVLIPEWMPMPLRGDKPAQGYYPTSSQVEAWEGRKVSPKKVTGR